MLIKTKKLILSIVAAVGLLTLFSGEAYADCIQFYGGGEVCSYSNRFRIEKKVRVPDKDDDWEDKVTGVSKNDVVEFRLVVENRSDTESDEFEDFDNFKYEDLLPKEFERIGGAGLTEEWDDFDAGEIKTFYIKARLKSSEFEENKAFDKCVVNKAELYWNDDFEDSDIATVCYGAGEVLGLPETGPSETATLIGLFMILAGVSLKLKTRTV